MVYIKQYRCINFIGLGYKIIKIIKMRTFLRLTNTKHFVRAFKTAGKWTISKYNYYLHLHFFPIPFNWGDFLSKRQMFYKKKKRKDTFSP
jgi:hypothetical protein